MEQNQKGVSMVSLVITIIVIIILAMVAFSGSEETIGRSGFSGYVTDIDSVRTAFMTEGIPTLMGEEETKNNTVTKAQAYNYLARGVTTKAYSKAEKKSAWLSKSQAANIPCTEIEKETAKDAIGIKLPKRKVNTFDASGIEISYFVTNKGDIFTWPPYYRSDDGLFYVNDTIYVRGSKVTSGDWIISGDDEAEMYKDGFAFMVNGVEIKVLGSEDDILEIRPDTTVEEIRTMMSVAYKDEKNAESPIGIKFTNDLYADGGNTGNGGDGTGSEGNEGGGDETGQPGENGNTNEPGNEAENNDPASGETPQIGETYEYGDYVYTYKMIRFVMDGEEGFELPEEMDLEPFDGWHVSTKSQNKSSYGEILSTLKGKPIKSMCYTFNECTNLTTAPVIPSEVEDMYHTFMFCTNLKNPPDMSKARSLTNMFGTFYYCSSLITAPIIPNSVKDMTYTFFGCTSLTTAPAIPGNVTTMYSTFSMCTSLRTGPDTSNANSLENMWGAFQMCSSLQDVSRLIIPSNVTNMDYCFVECNSLTVTPDMSKATKLTALDETFYECINLKDVPTLPSNLLELSNPFGGCTSLVNVCAIPASVTSIRGAFIGCTSLVNAPDMSNAKNLTDISEAFGRCKSLKNISELPSSVTNMNYTFEDCENLVIAPVIPSGVTSMMRTFENCTSLTGSIEIKANPSSYNGCFGEVDFENQNLKLTGSSTKLDLIGATGKSYCAECNGKCLGNH